MSDTTNVMCFVKHMQGGTNKKVKNHCMQKIKLCKSIWKTMLGKQMLYKKLFCKERQGKTNVLQKLRSVPGIKCGATCYETSLILCL